MSGSLFVNGSSSATSTSENATVRPRIRTRCRPTSIAKGRVCSSTTPHSAARIRPVPAKQIGTAIHPHVWKGASPPLERNALAAPKTKKNGIARRKRARKTRRFGSSSNSTQCASVTPCTVPRCAMG